MQPHAIALHLLSMWHESCVYLTQTTGENDDPFDGLDVHAVEYKASACLELHADSDW